MVWQPTQCCLWHEMDINSTVTQSGCAGSHCIELQRPREDSSQQVVYRVIDTMHKETTDHCKKQTKERHGE